MGSTMTVERSDMAWHVLGSVRQHETRGRRAVEYLIICQSGERANG